MHVKGPRGLLRRLLRLGAGLVVIPMAAIAAEADNPLTVPGTIRPELLRPAGEPFQLPPVEVPPAASTGDAEPAQFKRAVFRGNSVIPTVDLEAIAAPYLGRGINAAELEELRQKLTLHYIGKGYVNSGVLLAPDGGVGELAFNVVEGRLVAVRVAGLERLEEAYVVRRLARESDGPLNMEVLRERFALLLEDPLFARLNGRLTPGERAGEAFFDVDAVRATPYQLRAAVNNYRPPSIGSQTLSVNGWVRNLTGIGDQLEAGVQRPIESSSGTRTNLAWRVPLGYYGTRMSIALDRGSSSVIEEPVNVLGITSKLRSHEAGIGQSLIEGLQHKLSVGVDRVQRRNDTFLMGTPFSFNPGEPSGVTKENLWRLWQDYTYRSETSVLALRSTFTWGQNNLQPVAGLPNANNPKSQFNTWLGQGQVAHKLLDNGAQLVGRATVQRAGDRLLALDGMAIGGVNTVRGFRENQLVRDAGAIMNLEFEYPLVRNPGKGLNATVVPFYDHGRAANHGEAGATISSWGLANRIHWQGFSLDVVIARRLASPVIAKAAKPTLQDHGIHVQLSYSVF